MFLLIYVVSLLGGVTAKPAQAAIGVVPISNGAASWASNNASTFDVSYSYTSATGDDRLMLVGISWNSGSSARTTTGVTFGASSLTKVIEEKHPNGYRYSAIYYLLAPGSGVTDTVKVTFSGAITNGIVVGAATFANVDQTDPLDDYGVGTAGPGGTGTATVTSVTTAAMTTSGDELIFDNLFIGGNSDFTLTAGEGQTKFPEVARAAQTQGATSSKPATGTSTTMSWSSSPASNYWVLTAVPINPASSTPPVCYALTLTKAGLNGSLPTADPANSPGCTAGEYVEGAEIDLTAHPDWGYEVQAWSGTNNDSSTALTNALTMPALASTVNVTYQSKTCYGLELTSGDNGGDPTADPTSSQACTLGGTFVEDEVITLTAHPDTGYRVASWSGTDDDTSKAPTNTLTMPALGSTVHVTYEEIPPMAALDGPFFYTQSNANSSTVDLDVTTGLGQNRLMLVGISYNSSTTGSAGDRPYITSVVFTPDVGTAVELDLVDDQWSPPGGETDPGRMSAIYFLPPEDNPSAGTEGTLTVTFSATFTTGVVVGAANFQGVDQTTPLGEPNSAATSNDVDTVSFDVTTTGNELVFDNLWAGGQATTPAWTISPDASQSGLWSNPLIGNTMGAASTKEAAVGTTTMTWNRSNDGYMSLVAVPINPAPAAVDTPINIAAIPGVTQPVTGQTPVTAITETAQYTGTVTWSPVHSTFAASTVYTATITLTPKTGYTLTGVAANFFTVAGATSVSNAADSGVVTAVFPSTSATTINIAAIEGVTAPATGGTPVTAITETTQYTGTVTWLPADSPFKPGTAYTATITLTPKSGFTLTGVAANFFTVSGATATNAANSGVVTAVFPATALTPINIAAIPGVTVPVTGGTPVAAITETAQYTGTVTWLPAESPFEAETVYTATITLTPKTGYTLTGVAANFFTVAGATATNPASSGVVTAVFPATGAETTEITVDGAVSSATGNEMGASDDPLEFAHTTGTGSGRLMLVGISWNSGSSAVNITSVEFSYDTTDLPLTEVHTEQVDASGTATGPRFAAIYKLLDPPSGQAGTVTITFDADVPNGIVAGAINFAGVHPTTPLGTPDGANAADTSTHPSLTFSDLASGVLVFDTVFLGGADDSYNLAVGPDQTQRWNDFAGNARGTSSTEMAASPVTMSWTASPQTNWWALAAVPINPANYVPPTQYTITATAGTGGTISPSGAVLVNEGADKTFTITPNSGYLIADVLVDTVSAGAVSTYNFTNVVANHTIAASFTLAPVPVTFTGTELLGRPTDTSISVKVVPDVDIDLYYEYGTTSGVYTDDTDTTTADAGVPKTVEITGLTPNTQYFYRMQYRSSGGTTFTPRAEGSFWTQRAEGSTFTVDITSDSHIDILLGNETTWTNTLNKVAADDPDFLFDLGDTIAMYDNVGIGDVAGAEAVYIDTLEYFNIVSNSVPVFLTPGNHENQEGWHYYNDEDSRNIIGVNAQKKFFLNPIPDDFYSGDLTTDPNIAEDGHTEAYYSFTWGDALFVVINPYWYTEDRPYVNSAGGGDDESANVTKTGDVWTWTLGQEQFEWLRATLEGSNAKYKFVLTHQLVSDGSWTNQEDYGHGGVKTNHVGEWGGYNEDESTYAWETMRPGWGEDTVHDLMVDNCVSTVFHGHDHQYAYESRDGVIYTAAPSASFTGNFNGYTVGTGGRGGETIYANSASQQPGYIKLTVGPTQATVAYMQTAGTSATHTYTVPACSDTTSPSVTINQDAAQADPTTISPINFTVVFSEPVTGFETGDVTLGGTAGATTAVVSAASGDGTIYNVAVSGMTQSGTVTATVAAGKAQDGAGNPNLASTSTDNTVTFTVPVTPLTVTINQAVGQADPTGTSPINFTVVFSAPVTDFATGDVTLSGTAGATTAIVTGSGTTYNVAVSGMTQSGTVIATILAGVAQDAASTPNQASTSTDNTVTYNKPIYIYLPLILKNP